MKFKDQATKNRVLFNLGAAIGLLMQVPEEQLDLGSWAHQTECGTLFCAAGHLTQHTPFKQFMALGPQADGKVCWAADTILTLVPVIDGVAQPDTVGWTGWLWLDAHFGPQAFNHCFHARGAGTLDTEHPDFTYSEDGDDERCFPESVTDKALALWRLGEQAKIVTNMEVEDGNA